MHELTIRAATKADLPLLPDLEARADKIYLQLPGFADLLEQPNVSPQGFANMPVGVHALMAELNGLSCGFIYGFDADDCAYVAQLSVVPEVQGRGIGGRLLEAFCDWAREMGKRGVVLGTFKSVPWNAPFYARRGFVILDIAELGPGLEARAKADIANWGHYDERVVMGRFF